MIFVAEQSWLILVIAAAIGLIAGYWTFGRRAAGTIAPSEAVAPELAPESAPPAQPIPPADGPPDDLETLKGVGPKLATMLQGEGISRYAQIAALTPEQLAALDSRLGNFAGRLARDRVAEQAAFLARGDRAGFEAEFGKLGS